MDGPHIKIGVIHDFPAADGGVNFEWSLLRGIQEVVDAGRLNATFEVIHEAAMGLPLPGGSADTVVRAFERLDDAGVLAIVGPAITDNALITRPLADAAQIPTINYTGSDESRSEYSFHFQIGSLEDEPYFLAHHLKKKGIRKAALLHDRSYIGKHMAEFFEAAAEINGIDVATRAQVRDDGTNAQAAVDAVFATDAEALVYVGLWDAAHEVVLHWPENARPMAVAANSALIYGHHDQAWARDWEGWAYIDTVSEKNPVYAALCAASDADGRTSGPGQAGVYDIGRLLAEGLAQSHPLTRVDLMKGLEKVRCLDAATGEKGTLMGFGHYERGALKGRYLVIREWRDGATVEVEYSE